MPPKPLSQSVAVHAQLSEEDIAAAARQGYRSVVSNRPDGEEEGQPSAAQIEQASQRHGLTFAHVPVISGQITDDDVEKFASTLKGLPEPVLCFCRTGTRSASLWVLAKSDEHPVGHLLERARAAGYDLEALRPRMEARAAD